MTGAAPPAVEDFLADFHDRMPGGSSRAFGGLPVDDDAGRRSDSTYHALARALAAADASLPPGPVLDLACGDGHLLALLRTHTGRPLLGADLSRGELARAAASLGAGVPLLQARAQALPLPDASLAAVTCHMAMMLMTPPDAVLAEVQRVLRPGGRLLLVLPAPMSDPRPPLMDAWARTLDSEPIDARWAGVRFETRRWRDADLLRTLLSPRFDALRFVPLLGRLHLTPEGAWDWLAEMYDLALLPAAAHERIRERLLAQLPPLLAADGRLALPHACRLVEATRTA